MRTGTIFFSIAFCAVVAVAQAAPDASPLISCGSGGCFPMGDSPEAKAVAHATNERNRREADKIMKAKPVLTSPFLQEIAAAQRNVLLATAANQCGLRSDAWLDTFVTAFRIFQHTEADRWHASSQEIAAVDPQAVRILQSVRAEITCTKLLNSPLMDDLDRIQWKLTGGYH
jgi:hypothetical protein